MNVEQQSFAVEGGAARAAVEQRGELRLVHAARVSDERAARPNGAERAECGHALERTRDVDLLALRELPRRRHVATQRGQRVQQRHSRWRARVTRGEHGGQRDVRETLDRTPKTLHEYLLSTQRPHSFAFQITTGSVYLIVEHDDIGSLVARDEHRSIHVAACVWKLSIVANNLAKSEWLMRTLYIQ